MANNGGRQAGGGGNGQMNEHVEFTVKVRTIVGLLLLEGKECCAGIESWSIVDVELSTDST